MSQLTEALYTRLAGDLTLAGFLSSYQGAPAVFSGAPVPANATRPYVYLPVSLSDVADDTKLERGRDVQREIWIVVDNRGSVEEAETIAERVLELLHRKPLTLAAGLLHIAQGQGPTAAPSDDTVIALRVGLRFRYEQT